jgi:hypothetical protein
MQPCDRAAFDAGFTKHFVDHCQRQHGTVGTRALDWQIATLRKLEVLFSGLVPDELMDAPHVPGEIAADADVTSLSTEWRADCAIRSHSDIEL